MDYKRINTAFYEKEYKELEYLCRVKNVNKSQLIRRLVSNAYSEMQDFENKARTR